ncbi:MFS transporter [Kutzneria sp. NPDC051319]|uniref:MFS transporter n=1 Tax=Kutzneria sp. NPDC051319 TaxID=3155047 RepID=UPI0034375C83
MTVTRGSALWAPDRRGATAGVLILVVLAAFESTGVTTALPTIVHDLRGEALYSWPFTMFLAAQVVGNVLGGRVCDRRGPAPMLVVGPLLFATGLLVAGTAGTMTQLLAGRALQGFGGGAEVVALYVMIAAVYPERDRPKVLSVMASAWLGPSLLGPAIAGVLTQYLSWHWTFLGLLPFELIGFVLVVAVVRRLPKQEERPAQPRRGLMSSAVAAAVGLALLGGAGELGIGVVVVALALLTPAVLVLLPKGTLTARPGLPSAIVARVLMSTAFMGCEAFLPLVLQQVHGYEPAWAGLPLTAGAIGWAFGSWLQARRPELSEGVFLRWGFLSVAVGVGLVTAVAPAWGPAWVAAPAWVFAGIGMGLATASVSVLVLRLSPEHERGFNTSALQMSDLFAQSLSIGLGGLLVAMFGPTAGWAPLNAVFVLLTVIGALVVSRRAAA